MGAAKRKRQSTDSAIADMSSEESFWTTPNTEMSDCNTQPSQPEDSAHPHQSKRSRNSSKLQLFGSSVRDYGTAASQRPRRAAASRMPPSTVIPQTSSRRSETTKTNTGNQLDSTPTLETRKAPRDEATTQLPAHEVNGNHAEREQTPQREQASVALPSPPQTLERINPQPLTQSSLRRSGRERRPTERLRQLPLQQVTPCRKRSNADTVHKSDIQGEDKRLTENRQTYIVRLRLPSRPDEHTSRHSMSFTGSFSHRLKSSSDYGSQATQEQVGRYISGGCELLRNEQSQSFVETGSFQYRESETFAQPRSEPIPADSQELDSSQLEDENNFNSYAVAHLLDIQPTGSFTRERFSASQWIARQDQKGSDKGSKPINPPRELDQPHDILPTVQNDTAANSSWETQPTIPWCPPWSKPPAIYHGPC